MTHSLKRNFFTVLFVTVLFLTHCGCNKKDNGTTTTTPTPKTLNSVLQSLTGTVKGEYIGRSFSRTYDTSVSGLHVIDSTDWLTPTWIPFCDSNNIQLELQITYSTHIGECSLSDTVSMAQIDITSPLGIIFPKYFAVGGLQPWARSVNLLPQNNLEDTILRFCSNGFQSPGCNCSNFDLVTFYNSLSGGTLPKDYEQYKLEFHYNTSNDSIYIYTSRDYTGYTPSMKLWNDIWHNYIFRGKYER